MKREPMLFTLAHVDEKRKSLKAKHRDSGTLPVRGAYERARGKGDVATKKTTRKNSKRPRGIELSYRTSSGAKIVATFPRRVSEAEIRAALLEAAGQMARAA